MTHPQSPHLPFVAHDVVPDPGVVDPAWTISGTVARVRENTRLEVTIGAGVLDANAVGGVVRIGEGDWMTIVGVTPATTEIRVNALRVPFRAVDDDMPDGTDVPRPDTSGLEPAFRPAYVLPRHVPEGEQDDLAFIAHMETRGPGDFLTAVRNGWAFDNVAFEDIPRFWIVYIRGSFQDTASDDDNDPDGGGVTWGIVDMVNPLVDRGMGANIYMEALRPQELTLFPWIQPRNVVVHEVGHLFHAIHSDGGVMSGGGVGGFSDFMPITIHRIRSIDNP